MKTKNNFSVHADRNIKGIELEKNGNTEEAIQLYETNINEDFIGSHPYRRLAILYTKQKKYFEAKRVLEKAVIIFKNDTFSLSDNTSSKYDQFKERLLKVNKLIEKNK